MVESIITRLLASLTADPGCLTDEEMEAWVSGFDSWDVCDQVCMNLFDRTPLAWKKMRDWAEREEEFVKRAACIKRRKTFFLEKVTLPISGIRAR